MKETPTSPDGLVKLREKANMVFSEIPWEDYIDRMHFSGKIPKGQQTSTRSVTIEAKELRIAELIQEADPYDFQTISDVLRDTLRKGLSIDYEILVRRKGKIKRKGEAIFIELAHVDEEIAILSVIEMIETRIKAILKASVKNIAGRDTEWAEMEIDRLISAAEYDYPGKGIKEYFYALLHEPQNASSMLYNIEQFKKANNVR